MTVDLVLIAREIVTRDAVDERFKALRRSSSGRIVYFLGRRKLLTNILKSLAKLWACDCLSERLAITEQ